MSEKTNLKKKKLYNLIFFCAAIVLVFFDQFTKQLAVSHLKDKEPIVLIKNVFELYYLENRGAAFGIMQNKQIFFVIATIVVAVIIAIVFQKTCLRKRLLPINIILALILSGAIGNCIDRVMNSYVVDFFYFVPINFPIFNVADIYVTVSAAVLLLLVIFYYKEEDFEGLFSNRTK